MPGLPKRHPEAVLFDLDGVLWISNEAHRMAFQKALMERGYRWQVSKPLFSRLAGFTTEKAFEELFRIKKIPLSVSDCRTLSRRKRFWVLPFLRKHARLAIGLRSVLKRLRLSCRLALVSSGHPQSIDVFLSRSRTRRLFEVVLTSGDVPFSKPSPKIYQAALRALRIKSSAALAVEDTPAGILAAARAHIPVLGMRGTTTDRELRKAGARAIISRLAQVMSYATPL